MTLPFFIKVIYEVASFVAPEASVKQRRLSLGWILEVTYPIDQILEGTLAGRCLK